jgi:O-antigen/teichoic acid export membrane protein
MGKTKVIFSGVAWTVINNIVNILYGIISVPFLINYFGKDEYGLIGLALSVNVYIQLLDMGMTNSNIRFFSEFLAKNEKENVQKLFSLTHFSYLILGLLNSIILFGLSFLIDDLFKVTPEQTVTLRNLLWILALNATFSWISICFDQFLKAKELIDWIKKRSSFLKSVQFIILAVTIIFKLSIEFYFFGYIFLATIILPLTVIKVKKVNPNLKLNLRFDERMFKTIFPYAASIFSFSIFQFLALNSRPLILGNISGPSAVAEFNIMNTIVFVVTILSGSFTQVLLPIVTKMSVNSDWQGINRIIRDGTKYVSILLSSIIFLLILTVKEVFTLYVGEEYVGLSKWMILWLLTLLLSHRNVMTSLVFTKKELGSVAVMGAIAMILAIIAYIIYVPKYGVGGVVIGFIIHELTHTLFYYLYFLPKKFKIETTTVFFHSVLPVWLVLGGASALLVFASSTINISIWLLTTLKMCIMGIVTLILSWYILLNKKDKLLLLYLFRLDKSDKRI